MSERLSPQPLGTLRDEQWNDMSSVDRIHRLLQLVELLQSGRVYNSNQLAHQCTVSRRTIFRDLKLLQRSGVGVTFDEQRQGYLLPPNILLPPTDFTLDEALALLVLCHELGDDAQGIPFHRPARLAAVKLLSNLPRHIREFVGELTESISVRLDPRNPLEQSQHHYDLLVDSLSQHRKIRLTYGSLVDGEGEICTLLSPYRLTFVRRSWYVIGRSSLHRCVRTFNVGRIRDAQLCHDTYEVPAGFSLERYLGQAWSLIREPGARRKVVVRFQKKVAQNIAEVRWHKTQQLVWNDDRTLDFQVTVDGLGEITWWILGYGDQAEVLEPAELREAILNHANSMRAIYEGDRRAKRRRPSSEGKRGRSKAVDRG